jgi:hypothetical protein
MTRVPTVADFDQGLGKRVTMHYTANEHDSFRSLQIPEIAGCKKAGLPWLLKMAFSSVFSLRLKNWTTIKMWPFKKKQPENEVLADHVFATVTAIMAIAEACKGERIIAEAIANCEQEPSDAAIVWHSLNVAMAMVACKEAVADTNNELYVKCLCATWDYYPTLLRKRLYPLWSDVVLFDNEGYFKFITDRESFRSASSLLPQQFMGEIGDWNLSHCVPMIFILQEIFDLYCNIFVDLRLQLTRLG